jgi:hypothetical protein
MGLRIALQIVMSTRPARPGPHQTEPTTSASKPTAPYPSSALAPAAISLLVTTPARTASPTPVGHRRVPVHTLTPRASKSL